MNRSAFYKWAAALLLLINIGLVAFFYWNAPQRNEHRPRAERPIKVIEKFNFSKEQQALFRASKDKHVSTIETLNAEHQDKLKKHFKLISEGEETDSLNLIQIRRIESAKLESTNVHIQEVKALLTEEQMIHFKEFVDHISNVISNSRKKHPRRPKDRRR